MSETSIVLNIIVVLVAIASGWFLFRDIHSNGGAADEVRNELDSVAGGQQSAQDSVREVTEGLENCSGTVSGIAETGSSLTESIGNAQSAVSESGRIIDNSQRRIDECEEILRGIREGASKN